MDHISLQRIPHKRIRAFLKKQMNKKVNSVSDLKISFHPEDCNKALFKHEEVFTADQNIGDVWRFYNQTGPNKVFNDKLVSFSLMLSKQDEQAVLYPEEPFSKTEVGQVYFMNLSILRGIIQIAVSYELVVKNAAEKVLEFSYIEGGKSIGFQRIKLDLIDGNRTKITHTTHYKSSSKFRDRYIYPYFHTKVLKEYHTNMIDHMERKLAS